MRDELKIQRTLETKKKAKKKKFAGSPTMMNEWASREELREGKIK